jgi:hypothetical protein
LVIEAGYEHKIYLTYLIYRLSSITVLMSIVLYISLDHIYSPSKEISETKQKILVYFLLSTDGCIVLLLLYLITSTVIYVFHLSIVKEFYKIVSIIMESQSHYAKLRKELDIGIGIPQF